MTTRRPSRTKAPIKPPEPEDVRMQKARRLPMFGPGIVITIPLGLLPEYFSLYHLEPQRMKPSGILLVRRVKEEAKDDDQDLFVV